MVAKAVGIRALAAHLGLSIGTVSRALNGRRYVDQETRRRVIEAAATFGYAPNQSGRSLRQGATGMVAMMVPVSGKVAVADTIFMIVMEGLRVAIAESGLELMVLFDDPNDPDFAYLRRVTERRLVDGLIIADIQRIDRRIDYLLQKEMPFAAFGRSTSPGDFPWVDLNFEGFAETAIDRFAALGHREIACVTSSDEINYGFVMTDAYTAALSRHGIPFRSDLIFRVEASERGGYEFGERLLSVSKRPTAGILANETMAIGLYRKMSEAGLRPGSDFSMISFIEEPSARFLSPEATCFHTDFRLLGMRLAEALLGAMAPRTKGDAALIQEVLPTEIRAGGHSALEVAGFAP
ncbi:LacI family DNA-binding transcriptional regulator [Mesorhizobium calcicola]|uniref:LacI family DNA-binding transcriptional regulator n=1 Tax=Mesorhizobium calcicola TaxID=1300310 RepID=A0ABW4WFP5_9HYPH